MSRAISQSLIKVDADGHIPDNERWLHTPQTLADLAQALEWARAHPPSNDKAEQCLQRLREESA